MLSIDAQPLHATSDEAIAPNDDSTTFFDSCLSANAPTNVSGNKVSNLGPVHASLDRKPKLPYAVGSSFVATRHEPPQPFGVGYDTEYPSKLENWKTLSQTEHCYLRPPLAGQSVCVDRQTFTITATIRTGDNRGAQLVVVNGNMVAKIYDPLCYEDVDGYGFERNVVSQADSDYSREACAYQELQKSPAAVEVTPAFHGTWTTTFDLLVQNGSSAEKYTRQVPLILMEHIVGRNMASIKVHRLSLQKRSHILKKAMDAEIILFHAGVNHGDFCPRNVMVVDSHSQNMASESDITTIKVIDFNVATVIRHPQYDGWRSTGRIQRWKKAWYPKLSSPIVRWHGQMAEFACDGWCSDEEDAAEHWLWEHYHNDDRYIPVVWDPKDVGKRPKYVEKEDELDRSSDSGLGLELKMEEDGESSSKTETASASVEPKEEMV